MAMVLWGFPAFVAYIVDVCFLHPQTPLLEVVTESSFKGCGGTFISSLPLHYRLVSSKFSSNSQSMQ